MVKNPSAMQETQVSLAVCQAERREKDSMWREQPVQGLEECKDQ